MSNDRYIYGKQLTDAESQCVTYEEGVSTEELEELCRVLKNKLKPKYDCDHILRFIRHKYIVFSDENYDYYTCDKCGISTIKITEGKNHG